MTAARLAHTTGAPAPAGTVSARATAPRRLRALPQHATVATEATPTPAVTPKARAKRNPKRVPDAIARAGEVESHERSALQMWCTEISALPLPSQDEELALALRMLNGDESAREALFHGCVRWATELAGRYAHGNNDLMADLSQVASMTLWEVLPLYDWRRGRVTTFVARSIMRDLRRWLDDNGALIRRPVWIMEYERKLRRALDALDAAADAEHGSAFMSDAATGGMPPTAAARAAMAKELAALKAQHQPMVSLDEPVVSARDGQEHQLEEMLVAPVDARASAGELAQDEAIAEQSAGVASFVARIIPRERDRQILALYYGDRAPYCGNMSAIAPLFGITRERVRQIHAKAMTLLRAADKTSGELRALARLSGGEE